MTLLVCGEALFDVFTGEPHPAGLALDARIGGSAFNLAVGLARLGRPAALLTGIGEGPLGDRLMQALAAEGVDPAHIRRKDAPVTLALIELSPEGAPRYVFHGHGAADRQVTEADLPSLDGVEAVSFGCFSLLTQPTGDSFLTLAARARAAGCVVTLDPNIRPTVEADMAVWRARVDAFAAHAHIVKISEEDLALLHPGLTPEDAAARWLAGGASLAVLTRGAEGAAAWTAAASAARPAPRIEVADSVGAGDGFFAGLLCALSEGQDLAPDRLASLSAPRLARALDFAVAAAGIACSRRGADGARRSELPPLPEV